MLNSCVERGTLHADDDVLITVDSLYVKGLIDEKIVPRENRVLATLLCHIWKVTKQRLRLHIRWKRGHSVGNGIADRLADAGTRQELQHRWWRWCPLSGGWDEEGFIKRVVSIQRETTVCQEALETRWTGPTAFPRTDTASYKLVPALGTLTTAIAKSAIAWSAVKRGKAGPEQHDLVWMEVRRLGVGTPLRKGFLEEEKLSIALYRARQLMRRKQTGLNLKKAVEAGAPSRLQGHRLRHALRSWRNEDQTAQPKGWKTNRAAQTLSTSTSRSCSRIQETPEWTWQ